MTGDTSETLQKRALFYVFDGGTGVGHLQRLACIARQMQGRFACLIVTGHRAAGIATGRPSNAYLGPPFSEAPPSS